MAGHDGGSWRELFLHVRPGSQLLHGPHLLVSQDLWIVFLPTRTLPLLTAVLDLLTRSDGLESIFVCLKSTKTDPTEATTIVIRETPKLPRSL